MLFDGGRQFESVVDVVGRAVRDGDDKDLRFAVMMARR
jgi:hypothetical protein